MAPMTKQPTVIDKRTLEVILTDQQEELEARCKDYLCHREEEKLIDLKSPQAQVVIGVRRSGKSTLCFQALESADVKYAYADFDDERLQGIDSGQLNELLEVLYKIYGDFEYLFLDEIQDVDGWHLFVNRMLRKKMHVVITGSNAKLLSSELATHLAGRAKEIHLYPFSFAEYCAMKGIDTERQSTKAEGIRRAAFDEYMRHGGFPELLSISDKRAYVSALVDNILKRDIEQRYNISYKAAFEQLAQHLLNVSPTSIVTTDLADTFHIKSEHTVKNYLAYLRQAFILIGIRKYTAKSKVRVTQEKVYAVDVALMNQRADAFAGDNLGWRLETVVLLHLMKRCKQNGWDLYYLKERSGECDFIVCSGKTVMQAIQVSYDTAAEKTRKREINGLLLANRQTQCEDLLLLTDHEYGDMVKDGHRITIRPVYDWSISL
ncbi:MAG: ATP-binding protein [Bacteroidales bacterium]|nr:ATP-binding protein [Bacteroidales bacterium]